MKPILIVEDEPVLLGALKEFLQSRGFEVHCARELEEAEALLENINYALVITDLSLTRIGYQGMQVVDIASDRPSRPRIVVLTGHGAPEFVQEATRRGADVFLQKPMSLRDIAAVVNSLLQSEEPA